MTETPILDERAVSEIEARYKLASKVFPYREVNDSLDDIPALCATVKHLLDREKSYAKVLHDRMRELNSLVDSFDKVEAECEDFRSEISKIQVREIGRSVVTAWLEHRSVATLKHGDAVDLMERVGAAIEAERVSLAKNQKGDADVLPRQEVIARIEKQIRLWNNDTVTMACADMLADLKQRSVPASAANQWALRELAEGFIGSHERLHFNHNARIVLSKVSDEAATLMRDKCVEKVTSYFQHFPCTCSGRRDPKEHFAVCPITIRAELTAILKEAVSSNGPEVHTTRTLKD